MRRIILSLSLFFVGVTMLLGTPLLFAGQIASKAYAQGMDAVGEAACKTVVDKHDECAACFERGGAWTALSCLGGDSPSDFITSFIQLGTGLGGGIAFLLILFSGFQRIMSAGNPEKLHEAKELMTAAISGLLLIIFSIFILRLIGVDILQIPGLQ